MALRGSGALRLGLLGLLCVAGLAGGARGDELQLAGGAVVRGTVLKETSDALYVDLGFTVLTVPRNQILERKSGEAAGALEAGAETRRGVYSKKALPEISVRDAVETFGEGVVLIKNPSSLGSGFIVSEEGWIVTNAHVVQGETEVTVTVYKKVGQQIERKVFERVKIVAVNPQVDLALLQIDAAELGDTKLTKVFLGDIDTVKQGQPVFAIGAPEGLERSVSEGIVSTTNRENDGLVYIQTTAQVNPGNSGGPLFNKNGEVVGVVAWKLLFSEGLNFAIPINYVQHFLDNRDAFAFDRDNPNNGRRYLPPPRKGEAPKGKQ
ncbi:MAG: trypsin-like peptidase domain-containing protein [Planctomycetes bacterium]|nr:trypsin-like peptidase domain-containing protein [Planctomycetota bacterium]